MQDLKNTLKLASDLKPCNTTAAAYLFEVFLLSPYALETIQEYTNIKENQTQDPLPDLIFLLFKELEKKLNRSTNNCLQVDKYFCTYGIVFSIRHLLQKVDFL